MRSCFLRKFVFSRIVLPIYCLHTVLDHVIVLRLEALKDDYLVVLGMSPSWIGGERLSRTS